LLLPDLASLNNLRPSKPNPGRPASAASSPLATTHARIRCQQGPGRQPPAPPATSHLQIHCEQGPGDILVFLTGQEEITSAERLLQDRARQIKPEQAQEQQLQQLLVVPIYAALPPEQQMRAFEPAPEGTR
jgi:hypothetical protein